MRGWMWAVLVVGLMGNAARAAVSIDLEDVALPAVGYAKDAGPAGAFVSQKARLENQFFDFGAFSSWAGWAVSNLTDNQTGGWDNQFSAYAGGGAGGSAQYAVGYQDAFNGIVPTVTLPVTTPVVGVMLTNDTYTAISMRDGDDFAKKFGGATGDEADWFKVTITGYAGPSASGTATGTMEAYLADFRGSAQQDYIVQDWLWVDLAGLGAVQSLTFTLSSSDSHPVFGMNTPSYFALDDLTVMRTPEPGSLVGLVLVGVAALGRRRNRV